MIGAPELLMTVFMVLFPAVGCYLAYWVVRLGVRHGMRDVERETLRPPASAARMSSPERGRADSTGR
jgi:hypothetical protein